MLSNCKIYLVNEEIKHKHKINYKTLYLLVDPYNNKGWWVKDSSDIKRLLADTLRMWTLYQGESELISDVLEGEPLEAKDICILEGWIN